MEPGKLRRELGLWGAVLIGLGSILGTGAFVSIGVASGLWGDLILIAIPSAGLVASFSGLSSAFLAARYPVAGGTYEYGYEAINSWFGFTAGWVFLLAKTASAATAALGIALYLDLDAAWVPAVIAIVITLLVLTGLRRTSQANVILVAITLAGIAWFFVVALGTDPPAWGMVLPEEGATDLLAAIAFLFVAFTGYGRIATLGEEVHDPSRVIPIAVLASLGIAAGLYMLVAIGGRSAAGEFWGAFTTVAEVGGTVVGIAAITAMLGVLLNLVLGLSRVWLAMGRRRDMPVALATLTRSRQPIMAILVSGLLIAAVTLVGDIRLAWSFSAMTVLLYYAITNLAAISLDRSRITSWLGLISCLGLSIFVPPGVWLTGAGLIVVGLVWRIIFRSGNGGSAAPQVEQPTRDQ